MKSPYRGGQGALRASSPKAGRDPSQSRPPSHHHLAGSDWNSLELADFMGCS